MSEPRLDFWFDFASTYSYLAIMRIRPLAAACNVAVRLRPFLLGPIFKAQGWDSSPFKIYDAKGRYMWRDLERLCADLSLPFHRSDPFPQNGLMAARLALVGFDAGWGDAFCESVFRAEFGEGRRIDDADTLTDILKSLGIDATQAFQAALADANKARLRAQTEEAQRLGLFGAPSFVTPDGELFWGNDRLEDALAWAQRTSRSS